MMVRVRVKARVDEQGIRAWKAGAHQVDADVCDGGHVPQLLQLSRLRHLEQLQLRRPQRRSQHCTPNANRALTVFRCLYEWGRHSASNGRSKAARCNRSLSEQQRQSDE